MSAAPALLALLAPVAPARAATADDALVDAWWRVCVAPGIVPASIAEHAAAEAGATRSNARSGRGTAYDLPVSGVGLVGVSIENEACIVEVRGQSALQRAGSVYSSFDRKVRRARDADVRWSETPDADGETGGRSGELRWPGAPAAIALSLFTVPQSHADDKLVLASYFARPGVGTAPSPRVPEPPAERWFVLDAGTAAVAYDAASLDFGPDPTSRQLRMATWSATELTSGARRFHAQATVVAFDCAAPRVAYRSSAWYDADGALVDSVDDGDGPPVWKDAAGSDVMNALQQVACFRGEFADAQPVAGGFAQALAAMRAAAATP